MNIFSSEAAGLIEAIFYIEPPSVAEGGGGGSERLFKCSRSRGERATLVQLFLVT